MPLAADSAAAEPDTPRPPPPQGSAAFPIVGIGASAGGLSAFEAFFAGMPVDRNPGMAFVLVQHLSPDHKSLLAELVRRSTRMEVLEVEDGMGVRVDCAYTIPPGRDLSLKDGSLHLTVPAEPTGHRLPIDAFFRSLAEDQNERAIGVVLSGTGSDGTLGVRSIKAVGGMVIAQTPESSEFDGMPRSAIATGLVDYQLKPGEMAAQLMHYAARALKPPISIEASSPFDEDAFRRVCVLLRQQTGHDFSEYKPSTLKRRIERRLAVHQIETMSAYADYLENNPMEGTALFHDLLIGVTSFFRDPAVFKALEDLVIPGFFDGRASETPIRVWSAGCSTGEEAYSVAILLKERMEAIGQTRPVQVFATDLDPSAIAIARIGLYGPAAADQMDARRLSRWFTTDPGGGGYQIRKSIRDLLVFSEHDVIRDPPFSRLDLIVCRNLLIYLGSTLQQKLLPVFHYALNPNGVLLLGSSEGIGDFGDLFTPVDRDAKLFRRRSDALSVNPASRRRASPAAHRMPEAGPAPRARSGEPARPALKEQMQKALLEQGTPAAALVNARGDVLYLHGRTGRYLEPTEGEPGGGSILRMARDGLVADLSAALREATLTHTLVRRSGVRLRADGAVRLVDLVVQSAAVQEPDTYLILFADSPESATSLVPPASQGASASDEPATQRIAALEAELRIKEHRLESAVAQLETANEDLRSANEELQSVNEELQSANEELETSKEELQSVNEELATVNTELQAKVSGLTQANNDMNNLMAGTGIATVFVDHDLRILRFTPAATRITNLLPGDVGRPVTQIASNLKAYDRLGDDVRSVLATLEPRTEEVEAGDGRWYTLRIHPYRTLENVVEGAVITFIDVTERRRTEAALMAAFEVAQGRISEVAPPPTESQP